MKLNAACKDVKNTCDLNWCRQQPITLIMFEIDFMPLSFFAANRNSFP